MEDLFYVCRPYQPAVVFIPMLVTMRIPVVCMQAKWNVLLETWVCHWVCFGRLLVQQVQ